MERIDEKEFTITVGEKGHEMSRTYWISKIPAVQGREIMLKYSRYGNNAEEYEKSREVSNMLMKYVRVETEREGGEKVKVALDTPIMINNHVPNAEMLLALESQVMNYTFDFLADGETSDSSKE